MKKLFPLLILLLFLFPVLFTGCSRNVKITGQVKFDDGEPVNFGKVCFEDAANSFYARLDKSGHYSVGDTTDGAGIPPGEYTVWLAGTAELQQVKVPSKNKKNTNPEETEDDPGIVDGEEILRVHPKYTSPQSPDALKFTLAKGGAKTFDFTVERPPKSGNKKK